MSGQESKCEVCDKVKESSARTEGRECDSSSDWWPPICLSHCQTRAQRIQVLYWRAARVFCVIRSTEGTSPLLPQRPSQFCPPHFTTRTPGSYN